MSISYIKGDLFKTEHKVIAHGCNALGVMGSGVAKIIKEQYTGAFEEYHKKYKTDGLHLGEVVFAEYNNKLIANCITQSRFGRDGTQFVDYAAIERCIKVLNENMETHSFDTVAMPKIGAGLGGGNWDLIAEIIEKTAKFNPVVYCI